MLIDTIWIKGRAAKKHIMITVIYKTTLDILFLIFRDNKALFMVPFYSLPFLNTLIRIMTNTLMINISITATAEAVPIKPNLPNPVW